MIFFDYYFSVSKKILYFAAKNKMRVAIANFKK